MKMILTHKSFTVSCEGQNGEDLTFLWNKAGFNGLYSQMVTKENSLRYDHLLRSTTTQPNRLIQTPLLLDCFELFKVDDHYGLRTWFQTTIYDYVG